MAPSGYTNERPVLHLKSGLLNDRKLSGNRHKQSSGREISLDIMFYLCSYKEDGTASQKPSKKEDQDY
jgi:hypothetical protein